MLTECPVCRELLDPEATPGVRFGKKPGWRNVPSFGKNVDLIDDSKAAFFHPGCEPATVGYVEADVPPHP